MYRERIIMMLSKFVVGDIPPSLIDSVESLIKTILAEQSKDTCNETRTSSLS